MIPKTEIKYSWAYCRYLNSKISDEEFIKLKKDNLRFEELYRKYIKKILRLIKKYSQEKWAYNFISIYIVLKAPASVHDPLTLNYKENEKLQLVILIHELLHNNLKKEFKNSKELHAYMKPILNNIISDLPIDLSRELNLFKLNKLISKRK